ncbi:hypothetical protein HWV62_37888 [Athelia sp. TMB]|nr:hypothetical protein HWV62_37888 [Athelia sp. TMB]
MSLPKVMRAVVCPSVPIPPSGLKYTTEHPTPTPKAGHVLIRIRAFGLNRSELFTRQGMSPGLEFPRVLGIECVGEVKDPGGGEAWKEGDIVAAAMGGLGRKFDGGYAEYALVPHKSVSLPVTLPKNIGWVEFAAIPETFLTAWGTLGQSLNLTSEDTLLIRGGTTSVGLAMATLAKTLFAVPKVIATTRSSAKIDVLTAAGVDHAIVDTGNVSKEVMRLTDGKGVTKCVELVGATALADSCASLTSHGVITFVGGVSGQFVVENFDPMGSLAPFKHLTMYGSEALEIAKAPLQRIVDAIAKGEIKLGLDKVFKMADAGEAHAFMEANKAKGKVVCVVD